MSSVVLWTSAAVAAAIIAVLAAIDSAVLAVHAAAVEHNLPAADGTRIDRERSHRALAMARVLVYIAAGAVLSRALDLAAHGTLARVVLASGAVVVVAIVIESAAREFGHARATPVLAAGRAVLVVVRGLLSAPAALGARLEGFLNTLIPAAAPNVEERETSAEQFQEIIAAEAEVSRAEEELIHGVFSLGDTEVNAIMVPRVDMVGIDGATSWPEVLERVRSSEHARLPVYDDTLDNVVGILYAKDLLPAVIAADAEPQGGWRRLARPPTFIPISKRIDAQLREFQASRTHIAIVSDEYGGTAGLVTIEDILEEIVGEIRDEYDVEEPEIQQEGQSRFWVSGRVAVAELVERLDVDLDADDVTTVGGLVYDLFGRVPRAGESVVTAGYRIVVERVRRRRIERVYFERLEHATAPDAR